jgi:hypothetical protein
MVPEGNKGCRAGQLVSCLVLQLLELPQLLLQSPGVKIQSIRLQQ